VLVRDGQVYIKDLGSTNGTLVNDELIKSAEVPAVDGTSLKIGPLDFTVRIELASPNPDGTPLPSETPETSAALAAVKAATGGVMGNKPAPGRDATPNPAQAKKPVKPATSTQVSSGSKEAAALTGSKEAAALKSAAAKPQAGADTLSSSSNLTNSEDDDKMAAMLLNMEDEHVPDGSTVVELPAVDAEGKPLPPAEAKEPPKKLAQTREEMSTAASDLLRKMMRRPK
jgi:pSer/pThr/pTyr-binding forkhead associated (FHA) protein